MKMKKKSLASQKTAEMKRISNERTIQGNVKKQKNAVTVPVDLMAAARTVRAQKELTSLAELRIVYQAVQKNEPQARIAVSLGVSQPTISRMVDRIRVRPTELEKSPREIINRREVGEITGAQMMRDLEKFAYSPQQYDPTGGDGFLRGDWRQIEQALVDDLISDAEYEHLARRISLKSAGSDAA